MPVQTQPEDALLAEFQELIQQIGKEVAEESLSPTLKKLVIMWQAGVDEHQKHMAQLIIDLENRTKRIGEILSRTQQVSEEIDSSSVSLGEKWKSSAEVMVTGLNEILEKTDVPSALKSLSDELHEYQKIHSNLTDAYRQLKEIRGLIEGEVQSYRSLVSESTPKIMEMLESSIQHLNESDRVATEHTSVLTAEMRKLSQDIQDMAEKANASMQHISSLQGEMDSLSQDTREKVDESLKYAFLASSEVRELAQQIRGSIDKALEDAFLKYSNIEAWQEGFGKRLRSLAHAVRSLKTEYESSLESLETAQKSSTASIIRAIEELAAGQKAIIDRINNTNQFPCDESQE